jgi:hypothetical protein
MPPSNGSKAFKMPPEPQRWLKERRAKVCVFAPLYQALIAMSTLYVDVSAFCYHRTARF